MRFPISVTWPAQTILLPCPDSGCSGVLLRTCYACTIMRCMLMRGRACAHPLTIRDQLNQPEELLSPWHLFVQIILGSSALGKATTLHSSPSSPFFFFKRSWLLIQNLVVRCFQLYGAKSPYASFDAIAFFCMVQYNRTCKKAVPITWTSCASALWTTSIFLFDGLIKRSEINPAAPHSWSFPRSTTKLTTLGTAFSTRGAPLHLHCF